MSLRDIKKQLNIDQRNLLVCVVISDRDEYVLARLPDGSTRRCAKVIGSFYPVGSMIEVRTDGKVYTVNGATNYTANAAERAYIL